MLLFCEPPMKFIKIISIESRCRPQKACIVPWQGATEVASIRVIGRRTECRVHACTVKKLGYHG